MLGSSQLDEGRHALEDYGGDFRLGQHGQRFRRVVFAQDHDLICIRTEPAVGPGNVICHDQVRSSSDQV